MFRRVEVRICPHRTQLAVADIIRIRGFLDIDGIAHRRQFPRLGIRLAPVRPHHVIDFLVAMVVLVPALHNLDAVQIAAFRILERPDGKCGCLGPGWFLRQVAAHGHTTLIGFLDKVLVSTRTFE